jgi:hypothetical protein
LLIADENAFRSILGPQPLAKEQSPIKTINRPILPRILHTSKILDAGIPEPVVTYNPHPVIPVRISVDGTHSCAGTAIIGLRKWTPTTLSNPVNWKA